MTEMWTPPLGCLEESDSFELLKEESAGPDLFYLKVSWLSFSLRESLSKESTF